MVPVRQKHRPPRSLLAFLAGGSVFARLVAVGSTLTVPLVCTEADFVVRGISCGVILVLSIVLERSATSRWCKEQKSERVYVRYVVGQQMEL
jgi:hypothetical protein